MKVNVTGRHVKVTAEMEAYATGAFSYRSQRLCSRSWSSEVRCATRSSSSSLARLRLMWALRPIHTDSPVSSRARTTVLISTPSTMLRKFR